MTKYGSKGVTDLIGAVLLIFAAISVPGCEPQDPNIAGPVELPTADASQAGFAVERLQHLSDTMDQLLQDNGAPGAVALILRDVQVVYERAFGHRTPAHEQAMTTDTIFRIYSMTKPIVNVAVMMLWEDSAFKLDDPIGLYLPEFNSVRVAVYDETRSDIVETVAPKRPITIRDLLRHTSGMTYGIFGAMTPVKQQYLDANLALDTFDGDLQQWMYDVRFPAASQHSPTYLDLHACFSLDYS